MRSGTYLGQFLGNFLPTLRPPKRLTSTSCTYFRQRLTTALLEKAEGETKYVARPGIEPRTPDLRVRCPTDCATRPGSSAMSLNVMFMILDGTGSICITPPSIKYNAVCCLHSCHFGFTYAFKLCMKSDFTRVSISHLH